jgi:ArsR family metal-binding transcriptional regulator
LDALTTFADRREFERAAAALDKAGISFVVVSPDPKYALVGCPAIVLAGETKAAFIGGPGSDVMTAGWVDYRHPTAPVPDEAPREFAEDLVGRVAVVLLAPCVADPDRLRLIAHLGGDVAEALPYLNAELPQGSYVAGTPVLTFMGGPRMISVFRDRITVAKAADIVDAWAALDHVRALVGDVWQRRAQITPSFELRQRPPALEIYKRLPQTNCKDCGQATCMAFAWAVWRGAAEPSECAPVFGGQRGDLRDALVAVCAGLGIEPSA